MILTIWAFSIPYVKGKQKHVPHVPPHVNFSSIFIFSLQVSVGSESNHARSLSLTPVPQDENSNDGLLIVDEASPSQSIEGDGK